MGLGHSPGELGRSLHEQYSRKERLAGEMPAQKWFFPTHSVFSGAGLAGSELGQAVQKTELRTMGQRRHGFLKSVHVSQRFFKGSTTV
jgi:hypothetical protein